MTVLWQCETCETYTYVVIHDPGYDVRAPEHQDQLLGVREKENNPPSGLQL